MTKHSPIQLDNKAWLLLQALQADGRAPLKALADATGLSMPATAERLKRLQESGVIRGYQAQVEPAAVGYGVRAIVGIHVPQPGKRALLDRLAELPEVLECHHVAGEDSYVMQVVATSLQDLERFLAGINGYGETRTSIVFSTPIERRGLARPAR
jgi:Lrp/AsnC family leucine-responsive transcriptional regulator